MGNEIFICPKCNSYSLREICPKCNTNTITPKPGKFSPEDKYGKYRRIAKKELKEKESNLSK